MKTEYTISAADADAIVRLYDLIIDGFPWDRMTEGEIKTTDNGCHAIFKLFIQMEQAKAD